VNQPVIFDDDDEPVFWGRHCETQSGHAQSDVTTHSLPISEEKQLWVVTHVDSSYLLVSRLKT
jgi:hypothetical protein